LDFIVNTSKSFSLRGETTTPPRRDNITSAKGKASLRRENRYCKEIDENPYGRLKKEVWSYYSS
jgi:hypothetical protein